MYQYKFPDIGEGITEGTLTAWLVKEGDTVREGQTIAEIETDKMTTTLPSAASGKVHKLHAAEMDTLHVGQVFITIDDSESAGQAAETEAVPETHPEEDMPETSETIAEEEAGVVGSLISSQDEIPPSDEGSRNVEKTSREKKALATPVARKMAKDLQVDINAIDGTGPRGRVLKEDILRAADRHKHAHDKQEITHLRKDSERREPLTRIRKTIAEKMSQSQKTLVHTTLLEEVDATALVSFRDRMKTLLGDSVRLTYLPFILKAIVLALKAFPVFNSTFDEEHGEIVYKQHYHIGIATDTDRGLVVPVLFDADQKSIVEIAQEIESLAKLARENELTLPHLRGGTFSLTNYGAIGGSFGLPIINYPESGILGIGRIQDKPVVRDGRIVIGSMLPLSLSFDHRIIDGASGVRFIRTIEDALGNPELLLLKS